MLGIDDVVRRLAGRGRRARLVLALLPLALGAAACEPPRFTPTPGVVPPTSRVPPELILGATPPPTATARFFAPQPPAVGGTGLQVTPSPPRSPGAGAAPVPATVGTPLPPGAGTPSPAASPAPATQPPAASPAPATQPPAASPAAATASPPAAPTALAAPTASPGR